MRLTRAEREFMDLIEPGYGLPRCVNCDKPIRESDGQWFHVGNLTAFCTGLARGGMRAEKVSGG